MSLYRVTQKEVFNTTITKVQMEIEGIVPLLMDRFHDLPDPKTREGYIKQAEEKCYRNEYGELAIPVDAIKACMRAASSELGRKMEGKKNRQTIAAGVMFDKYYFSLGKEKHDGIFSKPVTRGKGDKVTRVISYRPKIDNWKASGVIKLMDVQPQFAMQALELGGMRYGILSHRPEYGRFLVTKFEVIDE